MYVSTSFSLSCNKLKAVNISFYGTELNEIISRMVKATKLSAIIPARYLTLMPSHRIKQEFYTFKTRLLLYKISNRECVMVKQAGDRAVINRGRPLSYACNKNLREGGVDLSPQSRYNTLGRQIDQISSLELDSGERTREPLITCWVTCKNVDNGLVTTFFMPSFN